MFTTELGRKAPGRLRHAPSTLAARSSPGGASHSTGKAECRKNT